MSQGKSQNLTFLETTSCEICSVERSSSTRLVRDHDHKTGFIRGMLCDQCNGRLYQYETFATSKKFYKPYTDWCIAYLEKITLYLSKPASGILYKDNIADSVTGFTVSQMKQQAVSRKSKFRDQAFARLVELGVSLPAAYKVYKNLRSESVAYPGSVCLSGLCCLCFLVFLARRVTQGSNKT